MNYYLIINYNKRTTNFTRETKQATSRLKDCKSTSKQFVWIQFGKVKERYYLKERLLIGN